MERDSFVLYRSYVDALMCLDDAAAWQGFKAIATYALDGVEIEVEGAAKAVFISAKPQIDANNRKYLNGLKGGKPKRNQNVTKPKPKANQTETKTEPNETKAEPIEAETTKTNYQEIVDLYNTICVSFPRVTKLSDSRKRAIKARLKTYSIDELKKAFELAEASDFISGRNGKWSGASFDWIMNETNLVKVLDGNYQNKAGGKIEIDNNLRQFITNNQVVDFGM